MTNCSVCGEPMPAGEEMFKFHGYSGPCPKPPLNPSDAVEPPVSGGRFRELWKMHGGSFNRRGHAWIETDLLPGLLHKITDAVWRFKQEDSAATITTLQSLLALAEAERDAFTKRREDLLEWIKRSIGTAWECQCGVSNYHQFGFTCQECGEQAPDLHVVAFRLGAAASHPDGDPTDGIMLDGSDPSTAAQALLAERDGLRADLTLLKRTYNDLFDAMGKEQARAEAATQQRDALLTERDKAVADAAYWKSRVETVSNNSAEQAEKFLEAIAASEQQRDALQERGARTPGAQERCARCSMTWEGVWPGHCIGVNEGHFRQNCPIHPATEAGQKREGGLGGNRNGIKSC